MKTKRKTWSMQEARTDFNRLVNYAIHEGPQFITRRGHEIAVVLDVKKYRKLIKKYNKQNLVEFFQNSPLYGLNLALSEREQDPARDINL